MRPCKGFFRRSGIAAGDVMTGAVPEDMAVAAIVGDAGAFHLESGRRATPVIGEGEVLIAVRAAGVNGHDVHQVHRGGHPIRPGETDLPGLEVAGEIVATGGNVTRWKVGDRVCALLRGGGYAEYAMAPAGSCLPVPKGLGWAEAAVLPETYCTVWSNIFVDAALAPGESFLMNGGTSGIGVAAIQIASALGHVVFATARGSTKVQLCQKLGASRAIDYETESFPDVIAAETAGRGVDVILDIGAGDYVQMDLDALAEGGRAVFIGLARGAEAQINVRTMMQKRVRIGGSLLRPRSNAFKAQVISEIEQRLWPLVEAGKISPMLDRTFPLADASAAIQFLEERRQIGKVALLI